MTSLEQHLAAHQLGKRIDNNTLVCTCGDFVRDMPGTYDDPYREHRAHVAASWQEARTVRTVEELDALPFLTLIREVYAPSPSGNDYGGVYERRVTEWECIAGVFHEEQIPIHLPALILWTPEDGAA